jgi:FtsH-binding integral membrane protein
MIQRIQTLWLLIAALAASVSFKFPVYIGNKINAEGYKEYLELKSTSHVILIVMATVLVLSIIYPIFLYKKRMTQFWFTIVAFVFSITNGYLLYSETLTFTEGNFSLAAVSAALVPLFLLFAMRGIWKDDKLVKSLDRLR